MITQLMSLLLLPAALQQIQGPEIQQIATATAVSTERLGVVTAVRELPDGRVLVNDMMRRRLVLMDSSMQVIDVVLDSVSAASITCRLLSISNSRRSIMSFTSTRPLGSSRTAVTTPRRSVDTAVAVAIG